MHRGGVLVLALAAGTAVAPAAADEDCGLEDPAIAESAPAVPPRATDVPWRKKRTAPLAAADGAPTGALTGKTVYLSAGHGFVWTGSAWGTQRGNTHGIVEDLVSVEAVNEYLAATLRGMGAEVITIREEDPGTARVIVDESDADWQGSPGLASSAPGWGPLPEPLAADEQPFSAGATRDLVATAAPEVRVVFASDVPDPGPYTVYISHAAALDRPVDAHWVVRHAGGESHLRVDQTRRGGTWIRLGRWQFDGPATVELWSDSGTPGARLSVDAVRIGGGAGLWTRGGETLPRPQYELAARYQTQLSGAPKSVWSYGASERSDDVGSRPRFAAWHHEAGEDAVYLSWHSNAPDGGRGTSTFTYGPSAPPGPLSEFSGVAGSLELQHAVHDRIVADVRAELDPEWEDRGKHTAYFGEVNPNHNPEMPALLVEVAFHATASDALWLRHPRFRRVVARAMARGVAEYFAERDELPLVLPPEPPTAVWVENHAGALRARWAGTPGASAFRVEVSRDGRGFDDGTIVTGSELILDVEPGEQRYVRIRALNAGGESLPSEVVGARATVNGLRPPVLLVGGFDRVDDLPAEDLGAWGLGTVDRMWMARVNDGSYAVTHGAALAAAGRSFDGATDEAIEGPPLYVHHYPAVVWFVGKESVDDVPFSPAVLARLADHVADGGALFLSGSELGWALELFGSDAERAFFGEALHASYVSDGSGEWTARGVGPFAALDAFAFGGTPAAYAVPWPDVLAPLDPAETLLAYDTSGTTAALGIEGRLVLLGFPFETVEDPSARVALMAGALDYLGVEVEEGETPDPGVALEGDAMVSCGCRVDSRKEVPVAAFWPLLGLLLCWRHGRRGRRPASRR